MLSDLHAVMNTNAPCNQEFCKLDENHVVVVVVEHQVVDWQPTVVVEAVAVAAEL